MRIFKSHKAHEIRRLFFALNRWVLLFHLIDKRQKMTFFVKFLTTILLNYQHIDPF